MNGLIKFHRQDKSKKSNHNCKKREYFENDREEPITTKLKNVEYSR